MLYARASTAYSPETGKPMVRYTDEQIVSLIMENYNDRKCYLLAPVVKGRKGHYKELLEQMRKRGYTQVRIDGEICEKVINNNCVKLASGGKLTRYKMAKF